VNTATAPHPAYGGDGQPLPYRIDGGGDQPPMLTAHGLVSSIDHWQAFLRHYAAQRAVVSWEYRGHGGQPPPADRSVSVGQFADDAHAVWRASALPPVVVVGLSFGVQVALELWRRHPEAVRALVLICGTPGHPLDRLSSSARLRATMIATFQRFGRQRALAAGLLGVLRLRGPRRIARELAYLTGGAHRASCPPEVLDGLFRHVAGLDPELFGNVVAAYLAHTAADVLPTIRVPTLVIAGDRDQLTPVATAEQMQRAIPGSRLVVFRGHTHLVQVEQPREVHAAIDAFLGDHGL
jgi:pimeloyl-ACP methyl ester carboxylesterase